MTVVGVRCHLAGPVGDPGLREAVAQRAQHEPSGKEQPEEDQHRGEELSLGGGGEPEPVADPIHGQLPVGTTVAAGYGTNRWQEDARRGAPGAHVDDRIDVTGLTPVCARLCYTDVKRAGTSCRARCGSGATRGALGSLPAIEPTIGQRSVADPRAMSTTPSAHGPTATIVNR